MFISFIQTRNNQKANTHYSINSLFSEFFREFGGIFLEVSGTFFGTFGRYFGGDTKRRIHPQHSKETSNSDVGYPYYLRKPRKSSRNTH